MMITNHRRETPEATACWRLPHSVVAESAVFETVLRLPQEAVTPYEIATRTTVTSRGRRLADGSADAL